MIVGLFPALLSAGGVQRAGRHTAAVVSKFAAARRLKCRFLSLNDPRGKSAVRVGLREVSFSGFARNKWLFTLAALSAASRQPRLVIAMHPHLAPVAAMTRLRSRKCHSIVFAHGIEVWQPLGWLRGSALRSADVVTAPSQDTARHLISDQGIDPRKVQLLPWGLDPEFEQRLQEPVSPLRPRAFPDGAGIILTVGRWDPAERYKGADSLISALPRVREAAPDTWLILAGEGEDRPRLEQMAREQGVADHARFLHGLTQEELFACYAHCDVFALPSRGEGFGLVFLEAMAHGKPVIGGAHGGIPDLIEDGVNGLLVPHGDIERLSQAIVSLLTDPERATEMGARGRERMRTAYTFEQFESKLWHLLEDVLARER